MPDGAPLVAPFTWYGGKRRWARDIWARLGNPDVYAEPFAGSLAVLLHRQIAAPREVVCDIDGALCNFWRAIRARPETVALYADWPTIHQDLTARHRWLVQWVSDSRERLRSDPEYYDARAAGWWVWGLSSWIGTGWCSPHQAQGGVPDSIPRISSTSGGQGVCKQRRHYPHDNLFSWFAAIAARLERVIVLNRPWRSALSNTVLQQTASSPPRVVGILLDPPYMSVEESASTRPRLSRRSASAARESWAWCTTPYGAGHRHAGRTPGEVYRIAYCCQEGDIDVPDGWTSQTKSFPGIRRPDRRHYRDMVVFSPACQQAVAAARG